MNNMQLFDLTNAQKRIWYTELLYPDTSVSQLSGTAKMKGHINIAAFMQSINLIIKQYDAFRIRITSVDGVPQQYVVPYEERQLECLDLTHIDSISEVEALLEQHKSKPLPLLDSELFQFLIVKISEEEYWINIKMHHIISDGISMVVYGNQLTAFYMDLIQGNEPKLSDDCSYIEYIADENAYELSDRYQKDKAYWLDKFSDLPELTGWKSYNPLSLSTQAVREHFTVPEALYRELQAFCQQNRISLFQFFMGAMYIYIHKVTNQPDVVIGTSFANRGNKKEKQKIGMFVSTAAARTYVDKDVEVLSFLQEVARDQMSVLRHQKYPYNQLIQDLREMHGNKDIQRLFGVSMEYRLINWVDLDDVRILTDYDFCGDEVNDFVLHIVEILDEGELVLDIDYRTELFERSEVTDMVSQLLTIAEQIIHTPQLSIAEVNLLGEAEEQSILALSEGDVVDYPRDKTIHGLFEEQAERTPDHVAVQMGEQSITYLALNEQANQLARYLRTEGVGADVLVGIMADRSLDMVVGMLAVLKAGGAYVPIDPEYPEERIRYMLEDSGVRLLLTQSHLWESTTFDGKLVSLDEAATYTGDASNLESISGPSHLAYVIYTSGTTGKPKGTLIEHKNVVRLLFNDDNLFDFNSQDTWTLFHSFCFDFSVWEMYGALLYGGKLIIVPSLTAKSPAAFLELLKDNRVTILNQTPTYFYQVIQEELAQSSTELSLRKIIFGGEALSPSLLKNWRAKYPDVQLINMYGITETTVHVTYKEITEHEIEAGKSNIGRTIPTLSAYIFDEHRRLQPVGVPGELYIAGDGLARGYLNRPDLTAEKFVEHPYRAGERLYRTGDLARWLPDGNIEYLGRIDHQVKIRGYRIELGEVEAQILKAPGVRETIVLARDDEQGQKLLCAYYVASSDLSPGELRSQLATELPAYMIPSYFVRLEQMPLTPNGKLDRRALPAPEGSVQSGEDYLAPRTAVEAQLVLIWQDILGAARVGVHDNFFEIGGHSLRATLLVTRIRKELGCSISLREVFQSPTVESLARLVKERIPTVYESIPQAEESEAYPVSSAQKRLYVLRQMDGGELSYNMPGAFTVDGPLDRVRLESAFKALIQRHESLRTGFYMQDGELVQHVHKDVPFTLGYTEASAEETDTLIHSFTRAFDLSQAPLLRVSLVKLQEERHLLLFDMHHIISDGVSIQILVEELTQLYQGEQLPELHIQYKDYAVWQREQSEREWQDLEAYWLQTFEGELPVLDLPTDFQRPSVRSFEGSRIDFTLDESGNKAIQELASRTGTTLYMVLLAAYSVLLHKYTGQKDIVVGSPVAGRPQAELEGIIGMFVNTLALRSYPAGEKTFQDYLLEVKETALKAFEHQDYPFEKLVEKLGVGRDVSRNPLFDTLLVLQNTEQEEQDMDGVHFTPYPMDTVTAKFDLSLNVEEKGAELAFGLEYSTALYRRETVERLATHLLRVLHAVAANPQLQLAEIEMITPEEKVQIIEVFNATATPYPRDKTIHELFAEQVKHTPEQTALVFGDVRLTYLELEDKASRLAQTLRRLGTLREQPVAIMGGRSIEMVVGMLAVLQAGGAYVPIDPDYPEDRVRYMLEDSDAKLLLVQKGELINVDYGIPIVDLSSEEAYASDPVQAEETVQGPQGLAYVIYTSGTTGRPKGVMVEHRNVVRLVKETNYVELNESTRILQTGAVAFDASTFEIWGALLNGGQLYFVENDDILIADRLKAAIAKYGITTMWLTSPLFNQLSLQDEYLFRGLKALLVGGDVLSISHINRVIEANPDLVPINGYGPTENTTFSTTYKIPGRVEGGVPIGRPISNSTAYVVNGSLQLQPIGAWGELIVGGEGVARGYLNRPDLTAEKFVPSPVKEGERCYRTGDLVRWLPDGNLEFKGRIDEQVKIRGYRIELPEIEAQLAKVESVVEAVVVVRADELGEKQLCAYYVADRTLTAGEVRLALSQVLPGYMMPSYFIQMDRMPLTSNGKVDRRSLPAPQVGAHTGRKYTAPRTPAEEALASVWQGVLGAEQVGIHDNFFELGGDSIKAIQVSSRLLQAGYRLEMKQLFKSPTIAELGAEIQTAVHMAEQGVVRGAARLTPVQQWFFGRKQAEPHHFNQAVMLYREQGFEETALHQVLRKLAEHHDALRMAFRQTEQGYEAWNRDLGEGELYSLITADLRSESNPVAAITTLSDDIQRSINLAEGPLMKLGLFHCQDGDHLLIVIHHLVVDGVSWRILFEDFAAGYEQVIQGQALTFPQKTDSFRDWGDAIARYSEGPEIEVHRAYWSKLGDQPLEQLPKDEAVESLLLQDSEVVTAQWTVEETDQLLRKAHRAYQTETNDLLLTALGMAVSKWSGIGKIAVNLEGHGREPIISNIDITRTVGWFTSQYPVILDLGNDLELSALIKSVKEELRRIPNKGIGYGLLKTMASQEDADSFSLQPEISFNYLGQFDQDLQGSSLQVSPYPTGSAQSLLGEPAYTLDINGMVTDGALTLTMSYNGKQYKSSTMKQLAGYIEESLRQLLQHCVTQERTVLTPSDVLAKGLSIADLEELSKQTSHIGDIENVYSLTPMQKGMLFHDMFEPHTGAYFEQAAFDFKGSFDPTAFGHSLDAVVERHAILRTNFYSGWGSEPLQVVFRHRGAKLVYEDLREMNAPQREAYLKTFAAEDKAQGFNLSEDELLRVSILQTDEESFRLLWSFHHIVMDGWCVPLITQEVFEHYFALLEGREPQLAEVQPYSRYIEWLEQQDEAAAADYWSRYLAGYEQQTLLPQVGGAVKGEGYVAEKLNYPVSRELTERLEKVARDAHVTMNILLQSIWGVALQRYNGSRDVVYGSVVSGRPAEIPGIDRMIGLFINTIPVRVKTEEHLPFTVLMKQQQEQYMASHMYDTYPLFEIQAQTDQKQDLISHIMVFENYPVEEEVERLGDGEAAFEIEEAELLEQTNYDFNLIVLPGKEMRLLFQYNALVYDSATIEQIKGHLFHLMEQIVENPAISVDALELVTPQEREQILSVWGETEASSKHRTTFHGLLEEQAARTPDATAILFENEMLTYAELNAKANGLARRLRAEGIKTGDLVGLLVERSTDMIVGMYGIMKAGGAYVPIDPEYPKERINYMLEDSGTKMVLAQAHLLEHIDWMGNVLLLEEPSTYDADESNLKDTANSDDLAYVIYTSGTTGQPKGVLVEHRGLRNLSDVYRGLFEVTPQDRIVQFASLSFDASVSEIITALSHGATLCIPSTQDILDHALFEQFMNSKAITIATLPPAYIIHLEPERLPALRCLLTAGSATSVELIEKWRKHVQYFNGYGPTEDSVCTTMWTVPDSEETMERVSIGQPIANHRVYILDDHFRVLPVGVAGELCISGIGLARGYHNQPALMDEKFVDNPFTPGERMYRTGDLVRWLPDGTIEYLGRIDHQVKIRGYRIELGEVEAHMLRVPFVQEVVALAVESEDGYKDLVAYFVAAQKLEVSELRAVLSEMLPGYMIPSRFVQLEDMPLTSNGKIDRKALQGEQGWAVASSEAPQTPVEIQLAEIWQEVLGVESAGVKDNFFHFGGHSLRAALLVSRIRKEMNREISLREVFESPTIEGLARAIEGYTPLNFEEIPTAGAREHYPLSSAQKRLFILSQLEGGELSYNMPGILTVEGALNRERLEQAFRRLIHRHGSLRTRFVTVNGEPVQQILPDVPFTVEYAELSETEAEAALQQFVHPFDLGEAPLLRVGLIRIAHERHLLLFDMHHIVSDGVSMNILIEEFLHFYQEEDVLPALQIQYTDYAVWQQEQLGSERLKAQEAYWLDAFRGSLPVLDLPVDEVRPAVRSFAGDRIDFQIDASLSASLQELATRTGSTLFMVLLAAYTTLLHKYTGQEDVIVGSPVAGRSHTTLEGLIGMFVGTVALRTYPEGEKSFEAYLKEVKETALRAYENQDYPFEELVEKLELQRDLSRNPLFDTMFVLQNIEQGEQEIEGLRFTPYDQGHPAAKFDLTLTVSEADGALNCTLEYATAIYKRETAERMAGHFVQLIQEAIANPGLSLSSLDIVTPQEKSMLMKDADEAKADYPRDQTIHALFEEQAVRNPDAVAVVCEEATLSYSELNERANGLARTLRERGLQPDGLVGIMADRSLEMVVGILAILKAGGAYVPVDPEYPEDRIRFMLEDSGAKLLLTQAHLGTRISFTGDIVNLDEAASYKEDVSNLEPTAGPNHLAYVIYTSGTTGKPKGTLIEHKNVVRLLFNDKNMFDFGPQDTWTLFHSFCFDFSVWEMYGALLNGGRLVIVPSLTAKSPERFLQLLKDQKVTVLNQTPTYFYQLLQEELSHRAAELSLRMIIFGGEALSPALLKDWRAKYPQVQLINMYGITETTVHVTYKEITELEIGQGRSNIGIPIPTLRAYILDEQRRPQPIGIPGELYVAGEGLARGYLNRPELTEEKFVAHPFEAGERMYRSGDLARWLPDGSMEYLGRIDHQVKIRGYRIELGEVEAKLLHAPSVREAVVLAREDGSGQKVLVGYFTADQMLTVGELRKALAAELPAYMIPSYFMQLEQMPLTPNGKLDRKALPAPETNVQTGAVYEAPRNAAEEALASVWQGVLGAQQVGIHDHFFDLGGDSIKAIQVSSRLFQLGYKLEMKDLFKYPTIAELSPYLQVAGRTAEQGEIKGAAELMPIQRWFFERHTAEPHHYNHAVMLHRKDGFDEAALRLTMDQVAIHHDALRMVFRSTEAGYAAWNRGIDEGELYTLDIVDMRQVEDQAAAVQAQADAIQASFHLEDGPLFKLGLFHCNDGDHLLIVIHHLLVDGVSWRILFEDIATGYEQALNGKAIVLPQKTDSYLVWSEQAAKYAAGPALDEERSYWQQIEETMLAPLPKDEDQEPGTIRDTESVTVTWSAEETDLLLRQANRAYHTETNDLLLTALGAAIQRWTGMEQILVNLEGHGREMIVPDLDITRTVGWFTTQYPVLLNVQGGQEVSAQIKRIKENLREVPHKGIGYGLLKYMAPEKGTRFSVEPEVSFNYLGQFDQDLEGNALSLSTHSVGKALSDHTPQQYALDVNGMIAEGQLSLTITYSNRQYRKETVSHFAELLQSSLSEVIQHCVTQERSQLTPSDVLFQGLTLEQLDRLTAQTAHIGEIEDVYKLTAMQKGMLFHSLLEPDSSSYFEQATFELRGSFDVDIFFESFQALAQRHAILRTGFYNNITDVPLQVVFKQRPIPLNYVDLRAGTLQEQEAQIQAYTTEDMAKGFSLSEDPLMRVTVMQKEQSHLVLWSFHHIVMDGWCIPIITQELFDYYSALRQQVQPVLPPAQPYSRYIEWLDAQDDQESSTYWSQYLEDYDGNTVLPEAKTKSQAKVEGYVLNEHVLHLGASLTHKMDVVAKRNHVTVNTLMQTAWGLILQHYNASSDVVFGGVVSGRPAEIAGIENMVGLFINTVPIRVQSSKDEAFVEVMKRTQAHSLAGRAYDTYPLYEIQGKTSQKQDLISHIMIFENYPLDEQVEQSGNHTEDNLEVANFAMFEQTNYDFNLVVIPGEDIKVCIRYNASVYEQESIARIGGHLLQMLDQVATRPQATIQELEIVTPEERTKLLDWGGKAHAYPSDQGLHTLFEEQVVRTPDKIAAVSGDIQITYRELNERANRLASTLIDQGLRSEQVVGLLADRSVELLVAIMGVLKAGGAYVPIDPEYPQERIQYILKDSGAEILLTQSHLTKLASFEGIVMELDSPHIYGAGVDNPNIPVRGNDLVYLIYTSGTTGNPKGTMINHKGIVNYIWWANKVYCAGQPTDFPLYSSISFDLTMTSMFTPLINGGIVRIYDGIDKAEVVQHILRENAVDILKLTPTHLSLIKDMTIPAESRIQQLIVGGENLTTHLSKTITDLFGGNIKIYNEYGPTETVVGCMIHLYDPAKDTRESVPIGLPSDNIYIHILDEQLRLVPLGVEGEMYIAGDGVARGYLNRLDLTAEKFIRDRFAAEGNMYRTGDLARRLPNGDIEYIGRIDHQVKIRGYRIELGEIEAKLLDMPLVEEALVVAWADANGQKSLCAYFVADREMSVSELRNELSAELPAYMIPSYFVQMDVMPLTPNGKLDRKALPEPNLGVKAGAAFAAPRTDVENILASIWQGVLGVPLVGIHDNFFELGGDSIKSIQVSSRLLHAGYKLEMKNLFSYPTIAELAQRVSAVSRIADQGEVHGTVKLGPAQRRFFEEQSKDLHHFNQSVMLYRREGFNTDALAKVIQKIAEHHDALRLVFRQGEHGVEAWNRSLGEGELYSLQIHDLQDEKDPALAIEAGAEAIQRSISLEDGPLFRLGLFRCAEGEHLLIVIHHLAVDGVSWRILFEDLQEGYEQAARGEAVKLPQKTDSYRAWVDGITQYANSPAAEQERSFWAEVEGEGFALLPKDKVDGALLIKDTEAVTVTWSPEETEQFLKEANRAYNTEVNDLLLTALGMAVHEWTGIERVGIVLEGHGREPVVPELDITRTIGWFTSQYPVALEMGGEMEIGARIKRIKEGLRRIPNKGVGYGILKYLSDVSTGSSFSAEPEITFNYLGQFDQDLAEGTMEVSPYSAGSEVSEEMVQHQALNINGLITEGQLQLSVSYNHQQFHVDSVEKFAGILKERLSEVIGHCARKDRTELTPSDVLLNDISLEEIEELEEQTRHIGSIENVYKLTPMQKGMLFHSLLEPHSEVYFEQATFEIQGVFYPEDFKRSLQHLMKRHAILRTNFHAGWGDFPIQIVFKERACDFVYEELHELEPGEMETRLAAYMDQDKARGFDLTNEALLRVAILRTAKEHYHLLWSSHHIILDGWCMPLVLQEVFETYGALREQREPELPVAASYSQYIQWLEKQGEEEASSYWRGYLEGYEQQTKLPQAITQPSAKAEAYVSEKLVFTLDADLTERLEQVAKQHQVTMNTLMQAAWGIVLQRYNRSQDVVFGSVVSGRPAEIPGIESMIGLFINTVPVRVQAEGSETFSHVMKRQQELYLAGHAYDSYPLYEIQAQSEQKQDLISHIMVFENYPVEEHLEEKIANDEAEYKITDVQMFEQTNYDFNLIVLPGRNLEFLYRYNARVYDRESVERIQGHLTKILTSVSVQPAIRIDELELITPEEKSQIIEVWGDTAAPYPREKTLHGIFEEKAALTPDHTALIFGETELTYGELHQQANRLARTLRAQGVRPDQPVGIMVERSLEMIIGIHAILKAGGAYVPIDPEFPEDRIHHMLEDSGAKLLLTKSHLKDRFPFTGTILALDDPQAYHADDSNLEPIAGPEHLAYIIYTSGSTGKPKGVMIEHRSAVHTLSQLEAEYPMLAGDRFLLKTTFTFDFSVPELFCWFFGQGTLVILPQGVDKDPVALLEAVDANRITHLNLVPSMLSVLVQYLKESSTQGFLTLKYLFACGETLPAKLVEEYYKVSPYAVLENIYGPTEAAVYATRYTTSRETATLTHVPIGKPYANVQVWMMDSASQVSPVGVPGELCIAGEGVARGYFNQPELTAEKFIPHPYTSGERIYRTGDLARWLPDGNIEYLGRIDHQVKIRGYRIELGEVEAQILKVPSVQEAVVLALADSSGSTQLCAYFVAEEALAAGVLREALASELPSYMIPSAFVQLGQMPLNPNGKLDRKALPAPETLLRSTAEYIAPRTQTEVELAKIWSEVLGVQEIGIRDQFFELGGHSLKVLGLIQRISSSMGVHLPLQAVFNLPTVEEMAHEIFKLQATTAADEQEMEIIHFPGKGMLKVFCFPPRVGHSLGYYEMAKELDGLCEVYGMEFIGDRFQGQDMLDRYIDAIVDIQAEGPYIFLGYSLGGNLAFEVAKAMESRGYHVGDIIMVDAMRKMSKDESTPEELEEIVETVLDSIREQYKAFLADPADRERVMDKMLVYSSYRDELINAGEVHANIHAMIAEDDSVGPDTSLDKLLWQQATLGQYKEYGVIGTHDVLLDSGFVGENAKVLRQILGKIAKASSKNKPILS
ncbi:non-ribosomal peptide synthase/polyketide synthase [Paenibacillus polymyxa]|uniref:non-ribosomal peptide synthase/polyketide synthase n=1 Tax=Paenibacillus polymyxa TaxID=1406 RepID=UPI0025B6350E|nr:non-ribosomal peptide synthase/polyketide synthase [Paenibacillus polymyxa]MDN4080838.1 non-ribosomal peptide synthase/polyketide synthase [Paenibacillus polymyxa]MDN4106387.1 non-ribosomal peptide synthase/polyketide synthase [Paenibacillus polymyxa]MDN4116478.1 non-ribosomal peptide synthase/polyketide synthase [Paenibacillus polymyxa]